VAIDSAPAEGVRVTPVSQIRSLFPILKNPANRHKAVGFTPEQFHYVFANTLSREESDKGYERYHIPAPGSFVWAGPIHARGGRYYLRLDRGYAVLQAWPRTS
jgi:hypothetical protein